MWVAGDFKTNKMRGYLRVLIHTITLEAPRSEKTHRNGLANIVCEQCSPPQSTMPSKRRAAPNLQP